MNFSKQLKEGLISQNPVLVQLLGMCSTLAITTSFFNGLGMGVSVTVILTLSNIFISLLRKIIPNEVRIACYIVVIAGFVTCVDLILKAFVPALSNSLFENNAEFCLGMYLSVKQQRHKAPAAPGRAGVARLVGAPVPGILIGIFRVVPVFVAHRKLLARA